ncbi:MAG: amino acid synthesis family protein [Chloroflexi bacterium]|nr:MAG: amino acid synthesis family protein [Chloroflexota bacterium]MBL1192776.1 amino acid synthesis family protein [Chloroflexota bacterium]NOH10070.1 amino acid synthesis family protein [Chloroflexota bacterium]
MELKRIYTFIEETHMEGEKELGEPLIRSAAAAIIHNPYANRYSPKLDNLIEAGEELGELLGQRAVAGLNGKTPESYGKAAIVGMGGEREHAAALLHPKLGAPLRKAVDGGTALIPSSKKLGGPGTIIDVPLHYKDAMKVRSHFDAMEVRIPDAPADDEVVVIIAVTNTGRPHPRVGGLELEDAIGEDGIN